MEGDDTIAEAPTIGRAPTEQPVEKRATELGQRYELGGVIGRGGMGEVRIARDTRIDREVAVKLMRGGERTESDLNRFFREARVQGVLEHPAVVPVHDLGIDSAGSPYFVMKRLAGTTIADVLSSSDPAVKARWPRRQLLARLVDICLAIDFAHARGVIHRDIKPANIMLGDYGEAYVLDWGLARLSADGESLDGVMPLSGDSGTETQVGALLGTPGYMSPEQARGESVDRATDVFALGMVLFEILAGVPALPRGMAAIPDTLTAEYHRPSTVAADVPPELDDACTAATRADPLTRPTARAIADGIQSYLDGDRDTARRRELAEQHALRAQEALAGNTDESRATAMREAGRAIALDPANATAASVLGTLLIAAPTTIPVEALARADAERGESRRAVLAWATAGFVGLFLLSLVMFLFPLKSYWQPICASVISLAMLVVVWRLAQKAVHERSGWFIALIVLAAVLLFVSGLMFGPLIVMPVFLVGSLAGFMSQPHGFHNALPVAAMLVPFGLIVLLETIGVLPSTMEFSGGRLIIQAPALDLTPVSTSILVGLVVLTQSINTIFVSISTLKIQRAAQNRVHAQTWHLQQLLPGTDRKDR